MTSFILIGVTVLIHVILVNIVLDLSILVPMLEYISRRRRDPVLLETARRSFRFLAVSDLVAGVGNMAHDSPRRPLALSSCGHCLWVIYKAKIALKPANTANADPLMRVPIMIWVLEDTLSQLYQ